MRITGLCRRTTPEPGRPNCAKKSDGLAGILDTRPLQTASSSRLPGDPEQLRLVEPLRAHRRILRRPRWRTTDSSDGKTLRLAAKKMSVHAQIGRVTAPIFGHKSSENAIRSAKRVRWSGFVWDHLWEDGARRT